MSTITADPVAEAERDLDRARTLEQAARVCCRTAAPREAALMRRQWRAAEQRVIDCERAVTAAIEATR